MNGVDRNGVCDLDAVIDSTCDVTIDETIEDVMDQAVDQHAALMAVTEAIAELVVSLTTSVIEDAVLGEITSSMDNDEDSGASVETNRKSVTKEATEGAMKPSQHSEDVEGVPNWSAVQLASRKDRDKYEIATSFRILLRGPPTRCENRRVGRHIHCLRHP